MRIPLLLSLGLIRRRPIRFIIAVICCLLCFISYVGLLSSRDTVNYAHASFIQTTGLGDIIVVTEDVERGELRKMLSGICEIQALSEGYSTDVKCMCNDGKLRTIRFLSYSDKGIVTPIIEGEGMYAVSFGYRAGFSEGFTAVTLPNGDTIDIKATAYMPEYMGVYVNRYIISANDSIVDVYTDLSLQSICGADLVNRAIITLQDGARAENVIDKIQSNKDIKVEYAIPSAEISAYNDSCELGSVVTDACNLFAVILLSIGLLFICIFVSETIGRISCDISVLYADGASSLTVICGVSVYAFFAMLAAFVLSTPIVYAFSKAVSGVTLRNMGVPPALPSLPVKHALFVACVCMASAILSCIFGVLIRVRRRVVVASHSARPRKRGIVRDVCFTCLCTCASVGLICIPGMYKDSLDAVKTELFTTRHAFDAQIVYNDFVPLTHLESITDCKLVVGCEPMLTATATITYGGISSEISGLAISQSNSLIAYKNAEGEKLSAIDNKIILSDATAKKLGVVKGDTVKINAHYAGKQVSAMCQVASISEQYSAFTEIASIKTIEQYLDSSGVMNCAAVVLTEGSEEDFLRHITDADDSVVSVQFKNDVKARFDARFYATRLLTSLIQAAGIALSFSACLSTGYNSWKTNQRRNSILIMLGDSPLRLSAVEAFVQSVGAALGLAAGIPLSICAARAILLYLSNDSIRYPLVQNNSTLVFGAVITVAHIAICTVIYSFALARNKREFI